MKNVLDVEHFHNVCRPGQLDGTCRYVTASVHGVCCEKHSELRKLLDDRVANGTIVAKGDNCPGFDSVLGWMGETQ